MRLYSPECGDCVTKLVTTNFCQACKYGGGSKNASSYKVSESQMRTKRLLDKRDQLEEARKNRQRELSERLEKARKERQERLEKLNRERTERLKRATRQGTATTSEFQRRLLEKSVRSQQSSLEKKLDDLKKSLEDIDDVPYLDEAPYLAHIGGRYRERPVREPKKIPTTGDLIKEMFKDTAKAAEQAADATTTFLESLFKKIKEGWDWFIKWLNT